MWNNPLMFDVQQVLHPETFPKTSMTVAFPGRIYTSFDPRKRADEARHYRELKYWKREYGRLFAHWLWYNHNYTRLNSLYARTDSVLDGVLELIRDYLARQLIDDEVYLEMENQITTILKGNDNGNEKATGQT